MKTVFVLVLSAGCATTYSPKNIPLARVVMSDGQKVVVKDRSAGIGFTASELPDLLSEIPEARAYAEEAHRNLKVGSILLGVSIAALVGGAVAFGVAANDRSPSGPPMFGMGGIFGLSALGVSLLVDLIALPFAMKGQNGVLDAINSYNDGIWEKYLKPMGPPPAAP